MSFDVSALSDYTNENSGILIAESLVNAPRSLQLVSIQTGIKNTDSINLMDQDVTFQSGDCVNSADAGDSLTLTQRELSVCPLTYYNEKCLDKLEDKWTSELMRPGSHNEQIPFEEKYTSYITDKIGEQVEDIAWKGDTAKSGNLGQCDGWLKNLTGDSDVTVIESGYTSSDAIDRVDELIDEISDAAREQSDLTLFLGHRDFDTLVRAYRDNNQFDPQFHVTSNDEGLPRLPGYSNISVAVAPGLDGSDHMVLTPRKNLYFGTDLENEHEDFRIFYDEKTDNVIERVKFKIGFNHAFAADVAVLDHS